jgi:hypothetical protein
MCVDGGTVTGTDNVAARRNVFSNVGANNGTDSTAERGSCPHKKTYARTDTIAARGNACPDFGSDAAHVITKLITKLITSRFSWLPVSIDWVVYRCQWSVHGQVHLWEYCSCRLRSKMCFFVNMRWLRKGQQRLLRSDGKRW